VTARQVARMVVQIGADRVIERLVAQTTQIQVVR
jgi:hypothetical protein